MRVLICGEGQHDVGNPRFWDNHLKEYCTTDGWMQPLLRKLAITQDAKFETIRRSQLTLLPKILKRHKPLPAGHGAKSLIAKIAAISAGFDVLIYMVDADSPKLSDWRNTVAQIEDGFGRIVGDVRCVACVPMSASESWLLSDAGAWTAISGKTLNCLPSNPEEIWGDRQTPEADHPHHFFSRVCINYGVTDSTATRSDLSSHLDLTRARTRCPISLEPFLTAFE